MERSSDSWENDEESFKGDYLRATSSMDEIFKTFATQYSKVCYDTRLVRLLKILGKNEKYISLAEIRQKFGKKHINYELNLTWNWYLTNRQKIGREVFFKLTSKGKEFLDYVETAKKYIPEGTSVFGSQLLLLFAIMEVKEGIK